MNFSGMPLSIKHMQVGGTFLCNIFFKNGYLRTWVILPLWFPYYVLFGFFISYAFLLWKPLVQLLFTENFWATNPAMLGKGALDQTSAMEFMLYAFVLLFTGFAYTVSLLKKCDMGSGCVSKILVKIPSAIALSASLTFWIVSFAGLLSILSRMGFTWPRLCGLVCAALFIAYTTYVFYQIVFAEFNFRRFCNVWLVGFMILNVFMLNGGVVIADGKLPLIYCALIVVCGFALFCNLRARVHENKHSAR
jgi:hypothetical protein